VNFSIPQDPSSILGALRSIGYDLKTALADLVDNSITALNRSKNHNKIIEICNNEVLRFGPVLEWICVADNGVGMSESELISAFKLGGSGVETDRQPNDLGRFGLGLKTATFSQCKKLSVISKKAGLSVCGIEFDLDHIQKYRTWEVLSISPELQNDLITKISDRLENKLFFEQESWTIIVWQNFDKLHFFSKETLYSELQKVRNHFSLIFHKFSSEIDIFINKTKIEYWNPFAIGSTDQRKDLLFNSNTAEKFSIRGHILKHRSEFRNDLDYEQQSKYGSFLKNQGFYVYRNQRLICHGDWLQLFNLEPHYNFARIEINLSNSTLSDLMWNVDISKSSVKVPEFSRQEVINECNSVRARAYDIYRYHGGIIKHKIGKSKSIKPISPIWYCEKVGDSLGDKFVFKLNRSNYLFKNFEEKLDKKLVPEFNELFVFAEKFLPIDSIFARKSNNELIQEHYDSDEIFKEFLRILKENLSLGSDFNLAYDYLKTFEPFNKIIFTEKMNQELLKLQ
jgi:hypothetical protein